MNRIPSKLKIFVFAVVSLSALLVCGMPLIQRTFSVRAEPAEVKTAPESPRLAGISDPETVSDERNNIEVYRSTAPGVVNITTSRRSNPFDDSDEPSGSGSGVIIDDQGHILTNEHVVDGADRVSVTLNNEHTFIGRVVGTDPDTDLAVVKIDAPREQLTVVPMGNSDSLVVGQKVLAIGNPFGLDRTLTTGVISGLQRPIRSRTRRLIEGAVQTDAAINMGNSGGPLLDSQGRIIGINSQILSPSGGSVGVGFAIPVNIAKRVVPQLIGYGKVVRPRLGIGVRSIGELRAHARFPVTEGLLVVAVEPGGPADRAGMRGIRETYDGGYELGDIITAVDGQKVTSQDELVSRLERHQLGDLVEVEVFRQGSRQTLTIQLSAESPKRKTH